MKEQGSKGAKNILLKLFSFSLSFVKSSVKHKKNHYTNNRCISIISRTII